jgi:hypothetical protein
MKRREFITLLGGAAAVWPLAAHSQQRVLVPRVGLLSPESDRETRVNGFREGLKELGYIEGQNIQIEYRWANGAYDRLESNFATLAKLALENRLVALGVRRSYAYAGGLLAYGTSFFERYKRAANYVDKILKGTPPADLPVEQPTRFDLLVNLKTAKLLDIVIPSSILVRAEEVIE